MRDDYRDLLGEGLTGPEATDRLVQDYSMEADDTDARCDFWLGLAVTQHKLGRLEDRVRDRAVALLDAGGDAERFDGADQRARQRVLARVRAQLLGPQRTPTRVRPAKKSTSPYETREVVEYQTGDGHTVLLVVVGRHRDRGGDCCQVVVLDGHDRRVPTKAKLLWHRAAADPTDGEPLGFWLTASSTAELALIAERTRVVATAPSASRALRIRCSRWIVSWQHLDDWFEHGRPRYPER